MRLLLTLLLTAGIQAAMAQQDGSPHSPAQNRESGVPSSQNMSGMDMSARQSQDRHMPMMMQQVGRWQLMWMGQVFLVETQQTGPRGYDKLWSTNWGMLSALHP